MDSLNLKEMSNFVSLFFLLILTLCSISASAFTGPRMGKRKFSTYNFNSNTTITSANVATFTNRDWVIKTGVTVTIDYDQLIKIGNLTLKGTAVLTHSLCVTAPCSMINLEIYNDATIASGATITANSMGYRGGYSASNASTNGIYNGGTTTGGSKLSSGGSHGGYGGYNSGAPAATPAVPYGSLTQPTTYGSGGGSASSSVWGGDGGGVIRLNVFGTLTIEGSIDAGGENSGSAGSGAGAGGSIWVNAHVIKSSSAVGYLIVAWGGDDTGANSAGGGGGRIAVYYDQLAGTMVINSTFVCVDGGWGAGANYGGSGTVFAKKKSDANGSIYFMAPITVGNYLETPFPQDTNRTFNSININSSKVKMLSSVATVTSAATIIDGANGGNLYVPTNSAAGYGSWFVPGTTTLTNGGVITEY
jgi:hypothetical protein